MGNPIKQLRINSNTTSIVWAMFPDKVLKTTNGGASWQGTNFQTAVNNPNISLENIELNRGNPDIAYVSSTEIWKNVADVWTRIDNGLVAALNLPASSSVQGGDYRISSNSTGLYALSRVNYLLNGSILVKNRFATVY